MSGSVRVIDVLFAKPVGCGVIVAVPVLHFLLAAALLDATGRELSTEVGQHVLWTGVVLTVAMLFSVLVGAMLPRLGVLLVLATVGYGIYDWMQSYSMSRSKAAVQAEQQERRTAEHVARTKDVQRFTDCLAASAALHISGPRDRDPSAASGFIFVTGDGHTEGPYRWAMTATCDPPQGALDIPMKVVVRDAKGAVVHERATTWNARPAVERSSDTDPKTQSASGAIGTGLPAPGAYTAEITIAPTIRRSTAFTVVSAGDDHARLLDEGMRIVLSGDRRGRSLLQRWAESDANRSAAFLHLANRFLDAGDKATAAACLKESRLSTLDREQAARLDDALAATHDQFRGRLISTQRGSIEIASDGASSSPKRISVAVTADTTLPVRHTLVRNATIRAYAATEIESLLEAGDSVELDIEYTRSQRWSLESGTVTPTATAVRVVQMADGARHQRFEATMADVWRRLAPTRGR